MIPPLLSLLLWTPLVGALVLVSLPREDRTAVRTVTLLTTLLALGLALALALGFEAGRAGLQQVEDHAWLPAVGIRYGLGVDGLSLLLVLLVAAAAPIAVVASLDEVTAHVKPFCLALLVLETSALGVLLATDLILLVVFWELALVPLLVLIGVRGDRPTHGLRRTEAGLQCALASATGGVLLLLAALTVGAVGGTFRIAALPAALVGLSYAAELGLFIAFTVAFALRAPLVPLHGWLAEAAGEAPAATRLLLGCAVLPLGVYGLARLCLPLFPVASQDAAPLLVALALAGVLYSACLALARVDLAGRAAFAAISWIGLAVLGLFAAVLTTSLGRASARGLTGALLAVTAIGLSAGALTLVSGLLARRRRTDAVDAFGGLSAELPLLAGALVAATLAVVGVPGTGGFAAALALLIGVAEAHWALAVAAACGLALLATAALATVYRVLGGLPDRSRRPLSDLTPTERVVVWAPLLLALALGLAPGWAADRITPTCEAIVRQVQRGASAQRARERSESTQRTRRPR